MIDETIDLTEEVTLQPLGSTQESIDNDTLESSIDRLKFYCLLNSCALWDGWKGWGGGVSNPKPLKKI